MIYRGQYAIKSNQIHRSLSDSKSLQVSRIFLSILDYLNNAVVWMVLIHPSISNSSSPLTKSLGIIFSASNIIGVIVNFMFHSPSTCLSLFVFFDLYSVVHFKGKVNYLAGSLFLVNYH